MKVRLSDLTDAKLRELGIPYTVNSFRQRLHNPEYLPYLSRTIAARDIFFDIDAFVADQKKQQSKAG